MTRIVKAISEACARNSCVLTGGETSEQPNVLQEGVYILTSSIVGIVDKKNVIDGSKIHESDIVIAIPSNGIHTNGYTLVRTIMRDHPEIINEKIDGISFIDAILEPHCAYYNVLRDLFPQQIFHGLAHITGGGICENLNRILPEGMDALIDLASYNMPKVFKLLKQYGEIDDREMLRTFNLGVGIAAVVPPEDVNTVFNHCKKYGLTCFPIGRIIRGNRQVKLKNALEWR